MFKCFIYNLNSSHHRAIAAIENPADVYVISSRQYGQRAVLKTARYIGATPIAGRYTPGAFTNQIQASLICTFKCTHGKNAKKSASIILSGVAQW